MDVSAVTEASVSGEEAAESGKAKGKVESVAAGLKALVGEGRRFWRGEEVGVERVEEVDWALMVEETAAASGVEEEEEEEEEEVVVVVVKDVSAAAAEAAAAASSEEEKEPGRDGRSKSSASREV